MADPSYGDLSTFVTSMESACCKWRVAHLYGVSGRVIACGAATGEYVEIMKTASTGE